MVIESSDHRTFGLSNRNRGVAAAVASSVDESSLQQRRVFQSLVDCKRSLKDAVNYGDTINSESALDRRKEVYNYGNVAIWSFDGWDGGGATI